MCLGVVGEIIQINDSDAIANIMGVKRTIMIDLISDLRVGDFVLIHAGMAIEKLKKTAAEEIINIYKELDIVAE